MGFLYEAIQTGPAEGEGWPVLVHVNATVASIAVSALPHTHTHTLAPLYVHRKADSQTKRLVKFAHPGVNTQKSKTHF